EVKGKSFDPENDSFWQVRKSDNLNSNWKPYLYDIAFQDFVIRNAWPSLRVVPHLYLVNKKAKATVDGLNQRFKLVSQNGRESVVHDPNLTERELGAPILKAVEVSKEV